MKLINPLYFIISFVIGLIYIHFTQAPPRVVIKYPTPHNAGRITYVDDAGVCYKYAVEKANCPANKSLISVIPIQQSTKKEHVQEKYRLASEQSASEQIVKDNENESDMITRGIESIKQLFQK